MLRVAVLLGLVATLVVLSRLDGHAPLPAAAATDPVPRAALVVTRGMTEATVRRLAGRPAVVARFRGVRCLLYATTGPIDHRRQTFVCFGRTGHVSSIRTGRVVHSVAPSG